MTIKLNPLLNLLLALLRLLSPLSELFRRKRSNMYKRIIEANRRSVSAFYLDNKNADVGKIQINDRGQIISSSKPDMMSLFSWLTECAKVISLSRKIFPSAVSED